MAASECERAELPATRVGLPGAEIWWDNISFGGPTVQIHTANYRLGLVDSVAGVDLRLGVIQSCMAFVKVCDAVFLLRLWTFDASARKARE